MKISSLADVIIDYLAKKKGVYLEELVEEVKKFNHGVEENEVIKILETLEEEGLAKISYKLTRVYITWTGPEVVNINKKTNEEREEIEEKLEEIKKEVGMIKVEEKVMKGKEEKREKRKKKKGIEEKRREELVAKEVKMEKLEADKKERREDTEKEKIGIEAKRDIGWSINYKFLVVLFGFIAFAIFLYYIFASSYPIKVEDRTVQVASIFDRNTTNLPAEEEMKTSEKEKNEEKRSEKEGEITIVYINSSASSIEPSIIEVEKGKKVKLIINNNEVEYTLSVSGYNITKEIKIGENIIEFFAYKEGKFYLSGYGIYPISAVLIVK